MADGGNSFFPGERKPDERQDVTAELNRLEEMIESLRVEYEQYFSGILPMVPEKKYAEVKRFIRLLMQAPFRTSAHNFRLKALKNRFSSFDTYWQRVLKQREQGTYSKDVFKANLRQRIAKEDRHAASSSGTVEREFSALFNSYCAALEKQTGQKARLDYNTFQQSLLKRAKEFKAKHAGQKIAFQVVIQNGKVAIQARAKGQEPEG